MTETVGAFLGALAGQLAGAWLAWRYYLAPKFKRASTPAPRPAAPRSQPATATTRGFVAHDGPVTVQRAQWGRMKKRTSL
jgi:hypothetical protein